MEDQNKKPRDILREGALAQKSLPNKSAAKTKKISFIGKLFDKTSAKDGDAGAAAKAPTLSGVPPKAEQSDDRESEKKLEDEEVQDILLRASYVSDKDLKVAQNAAKKLNTTVQEQLISGGKVTKDMLGQAISEYYRVPYADLNTKVPSKKEAQRVPEAVARKLHVVFFEETPDFVTFTTDNPIHPELRAALLDLVPHKKINIAYSVSEDIDNVLTSYRTSLETRFQEIIISHKRVAPEIVDEILLDAVAYRASDIHFEPRKKEIVIRFRIDGTLQEAGRIEKRHYENILNRIKIQARMRIDEHEATQDGAIRFEKGKDIFDVRVSIAPTMEGEKVVMRLLAQYVQSFTMSDLGLSKANQAMLERAAKKPFGMILVTGPTGSGKSTTLYAVLKSLNQPEVNITTIEDPVEYRLVGISQIQVNKEKNITFAKGLRSIVRQDPDIILVGEIRDKETAEIAVNAALTGHLLLSTFHANDAATTIPRLLDMEVEPFLMASTLELIIAQRLVRKICDHCRVSEDVPREEIAKINRESAKYFNDTNLLYRGKGCSTCAHTGYKGRTAIYEFIEITSQVNDLILKNPSTRQIWEMAHSQGSISLFEDGVEKVKSGITTVRELLRVAQPPESDAVPKS